ncbi:MAG TPA: penicillin-binding transpeptidase domain-containing protein [Bacillota bacterium]|nr:penicillin-binding transpeptidase domain-containing protein [Bacillota bacterium]
MRDDFGRRVTAMVVVFVACALLVLSRLAYIQVVHGEDYRERSDNNRLRQLTSLAPRGVIYDAYGTPVAENRPGYFVAIYDTRSPGQTDVLQRLVDIIDPQGENPDVSVEEFRARIFQNRYRRWQPVRLIDFPLEFGDERLIQINEMRSDLPDVIVQVQPVRHYPLGDLAAHILGGMGRYTGSWVELNGLWDAGMTDYKIDSIVGRWGIEAAYEFVDPAQSLKGTDGWQWIEVDNLSRPVQEMEAVHAVPGNNLHLTIDASFQALIEDYIANDYVPNVLSTLGTETSEIGVVALDPRDGRVLLSVSYPGFTPATLSADYLNLLSTMDRPLENKVVTAYAPGSIFKPVTIIAALAQGANINATYTCTGRLTHPWLASSGKLCWIHGYGRGHGTLDIVGALKNSCNVYFYNLGLNLYSQKGSANVLDSISEAASFLGLGVNTLLPELRNFRQDSGELPTSERFRELQKAYLARFPQNARSLNPYPGEVLDITIGQGIQTYSPLQIANYIGMLATGYRYEPWLLERVTDHEGATVMVHEPVLAASLVKTENNPDGLITAAALARIQEGLRQVTQVSGGTGNAYFRDVPYFTSGKTGTAEVTGRASHGWFAVWGSDDASSQPEIVVAVFVKHGTGGSVAGGPIARKVMDTYFALKGERLSD